MIEQTALGLKLRRMEHTCVSTCRVSASVNRPGREQHFQMVLAPIRVTWRDRIRLWLSGLGW